MEDRRREKEQRNIRKETKTKETDKQKDKKT